jgi:pyruvate formate lyase activating enzyme
LKYTALLYKEAGDNKVDCYLCAHRCRISEGKYGVCRVRKNEGGELYSMVYGDVIAANMDPIEKKPLYHFLPGTLSYSIATVGCNFRCGFCQNWQISQVAGEDIPRSGAKRMMPEEIVNQAMRMDSASVSYTYTEPTIFFEYAYETAKLATEKGIRNVFVTNGYMTAEALEMIKPYLDAANVDLKYFKDESYRKICKARLRPVLDSIKKMKDLGIWVEVTTLIVPGENDSDEELESIAEFLVSIDAYMPWHISRFFPNYNYPSVAPTPLDTINKTMKIGEQAGLKFIYPGNIGQENSTACPSCGAELLSRSAFTVFQNRLDKGRCHKCTTPIQGIWE